MAFHIVDFNKTVDTVTIVPVAGSGQSVASCLCPKYRVLLYVQLTSRDTQRAVARTAEQTYTRPLR